MLKRLALALGVTLALSQTALADDHPAPPPPAPASAPVDSHLAAAIDLLEAQNAKANMKIMTDALMVSATAAFRAEHPNLTDEKLKIFTDAFTEEIDGSFDDLLKMQAKVFEEHFSESELRSLAAFYRSDVGKKYIAETPSIMKEVIPVSVRWGQMIAPIAVQHAIDKMKKKGVQL